MEELVGGLSNTNSSAGRKRTLSDSMQGKEKDKEKERPKNGSRNGAGTGSSSIFSVS